MVGVASTDGFVFAGPVNNRGVNVAPLPLPPGRTRHKFGEGPFARLVMPQLPNEPGVYLWDLDGVIVYVGQTRTPLKERLGSRGYATISNYNTFAREAGRKNGGQQTNCRVNALANMALSQGRKLSIWYLATSAADAAPQEAKWMAAHGKPEWNRRLEHER